MWTGNTSGWGGGGCACVCVGGWGRGVVCYDSRCPWWGGGRCVLSSGANTRCRAVEAAQAAPAVLRCDVLTSDPPQVELRNSLHLQISLRDAPSCRSSSVPVMALMSSLHPSLPRSLAPSSEFAFTLLQRQQRGFPGEFYKCLSAGTVGTSLFPSARKRSSERHQSSARWEF